MKVCKFFVATIALVLISGVAFAQKKHDSAVIVVDVSETIVNSNNVSAVKQILLDMNSKFPDYVKSGGVMVFGKLSPPTSEWSMPVTQWDRSQTASAIRDIKGGNGGTAIGAALKCAAPGVDKAQEKTALIIVSDGKNNGVADPVEVVREMKAKHGSNLCVFTIHVGNDSAGKKLLDDMVSAGECGLSRDASALQSDAQVQELVDYIFPTVAPAPAPKPQPKDSDGDGVYDKNDECPGTLSGAKVNDRGCWALENVRFSSGSAEIQSRYYSDLDNVLKVLKSNPGIEVVIEGHTDNQGSKELNKELSRKRAQSVMNYLIENGVKAERVSAKGYGESQPIADNDTAAGRAKNRRIEIHVKK